MKIPRIENLDLRTGQSETDTQWAAWDEITWPWAFLFDYTRGLREAAKHVVIPFPLKRR